MKLVRLVYYSHASREMSLSDLKSILDTARRNNQAEGICG
ncbi:MAG: blue light sensor protein, partial [Aestuariibacter sp.]|nr:blue light sensor protein [Aestuariibacter sp.]